MRAAPWPGCAVRAPCTPSRADPPHPRCRRPSIPTSTSTPILTCHDTHTNTTHQQTVCCEAIEASACVRDRCWGDGARGGRGVHMCARATHALPAPARHPAPPFARAPQTCARDACGMPALTEAARPASLCHPMGSGRTASVNSADSRAVGKSRSERSRGEQHSRGGRDQG